MREYIQVQDSIYSKRGGFKRMITVVDHKMMFCFVDLQRGFVRRTPRNPPPTRLDIKVLLLKMTVTSFSEDGL